MVTRTSVGSGLIVCLLILLPHGFAAAAGSGKILHVTGTGVDLLNDAVVHLKKSTPDGEIQKSTEIVELTGDLKGKVLYHVTSSIDTKKNILVNTGDQVFSGTIAGSEPVMLHDSKFRFEVNLATGSDIGSAYLTDHIAGPRASCELKVTGTGKNAAGNPTFNYTGTCRLGTG